MFISRIEDCRELFNIMNSSDLDLREQLTKIIELPNKTIRLDDSDKFIRKLRKLISKMNCVDDIPLAVSVWCASMDGFLQTSLYKQQSVTLEHALFSSCIHNKYHDPKNYIKILLNLLSNAIYESVSKRNPWALFHGYNPSIECLQPITFCHSCCIELMKRIDILLNIFNFQVD
eukprot:198983_1